MNTRGHWRRILYWFLNSLIDISPLTLFLLGVGGFWAVYQVYLKPQADDAYNKTYSTLEKSNTELRHNILALESENNRLRESIRVIKSFGQYISTIKARNDQITSVLADFLVINVHCSSEGCEGSSMLIDTCKSYVYHKDCQSDFKIYRIRCSMYRFP